MANNNQYTYSLPEALTQEQKVVINQYLITKQQFIILQEQAIDWYTGPLLKLKALFLKLINHNFLKPYYSSNNYRLRFYSAQIYFILQKIIKNTHFIQLYDNYLICIPIQIFKWTNNSYSQLLNMKIEQFMNSPIVIDNGSGYIKAGFSGEQKPNLIFPSIVGRPKYKVVIPTSTQSEVYLGEEIENEKRGLLKLRYPINHGIIQNWDDMELLWSHVYNQLKVSSKQYPVLLTEPGLNPLSQRVKLIDTFFSKFGAPAVFVAIQGVLSLFGNGKTTGIALDSGDGVTQVVPVYEGYSLPHAFERIDLGGRDVTNHLMQLYRKNGYNFHTSAQFELVKKIKQTKCSISTYYIDKDDDRNKRQVKDKYILPDGTTLELSTERTLAGQILFTPEKAGLEYPSISQLTVNSIQKVDLDLRKALYNQILLAGGNTMFQGFHERFINDIKKLVGNQLKIRVLSNSKRATVCWSGGSILSKLTYFKNMWITKSQFQQQGPRIIMKKML